MHYIVIDVEFNGRRFASELPMEVIELGAVCLNERLEVVGEFSRFIKPVYFAKLNKFIRQKTGILQEQIDEAARFPVVFHSFVQWLAQYDSAIIFTWGGEDLKRLLLDTRMHKLDETVWQTTLSFDLLKGYIRAKQLKNDISVENALIECGFTVEQPAHRAINDAHMTAQILVAIFAELDITQATPYKEQVTNAKERQLLKNAMRNYRRKQLTPDWNQIYQQYLKDQPFMTDERKATELKQYFDEKMAQNH